MPNISKFDEQCITYSQMNLIYNSRIFWRRFTTWIRVYLISRYVGIGTAEEAFGRLYLEAGEFGNMLRLVSGRDIANQYTQLLNQYVFGLRDLITAQLAGNTEAINQNVDRLYKNVDTRASFLSSINPYLNEAEWRDMLSSYLQLTIEEANAFILGDYSRDIETFDRLTDLTNQMGYVFAQSIYDYITTDCQCTNHLMPEQCLTYEEMNQVYNIRMFWFELDTWIRAYMLSRYKGIGNSEEILARLKQVPVIYTDMLDQVFGDGATERDLQLINEHIDLIDALITAQIQGDTDEVNRLTQLLYQNADQRAAFLASVNPYWDQNEWKARLYEKIRGNINQLTTFQTGDFARNLDIFSTLLDQAESTSSYYAQGLFEYIRNQRRNQSK
jgi:hypothetical protein